MGDSVVRHGVYGVGGGSGGGGAEAGWVDGAVVVGGGGEVLEEEGVDVVVDGGVGGVGHGVVVWGVGVAGGTSIVVGGVGDVGRDRDVVCYCDRVVGIVVASNVRSALVDRTDRSHFRV